MTVRSSIGLPHLSQFGGVFPCGALSGGSDTATPSDKQAKDESSPFSKPASGRSWIMDRRKFRRKGRPYFRRAALSIRRLAILRGVRRVGAGGRSRQDTARIK